MNLLKNFWHSALLVLFCLAGCGEKAPQMNDTKSIKTEIIAPNEVKSDSKSKNNNKGLSEVGGIKIGDPIERIDIIFGINASHPTDYIDLSLKSDAIKDFEIIGFSLWGEREVKSATQFNAIKSKSGKIRAISCNLLFFDHKEHQQFNGEMGEVYFYSINPSPCHSGKIRLYKPIFNEAFGEVAGVKESNIQQLLGDPEETKKIGEADALLIGWRQMEKYLNHDTKAIRKIKYGNSYIYALKDRVIGMVVFDDHFKEIYEKIEAGIIKLK